MKECRHIVLTGNKVERKIGDGCKLFYNGAD